MFWWGDAPLLATPERARVLYPLLLLACRGALALRGLPVDPGSSGSAGVVNGAEGSTNRIGPAA